MNENDFRDVCAMLSMVGLVMAYKDGCTESELAKRSYDIADAMLEARKKDDGEELGIAAIKPKRRYARRDN